MIYTTAVCTVKTPDDGQRNCPKHAEFYFKNKFEKLVHLVGFTIRIYRDARSPERQNTKEDSICAPGLGSSGLPKLQQLITLSITPLCRNTEREPS